MSDSFLALRRADGEDLGDYTFLCVSDADSAWEYATGDAEDAEPTEFELVRLVVEVVETRTFGGNPACHHWAGPTTERSWVEVILRPDGTGENWPVQATRVQHCTTQAEADAVIAALPERFYVHSGHQLVEVERHRLATKAHGWRDQGDCARCGRSFYSHTPDARAKASL